MDLKALVRRKRAEFQSFVRPYSAAVCGADDNGYYVFGATGFFLQLRRGLVLVTAEHVIRAIPGGPRAVLEGKTIEAHGLPKFATDSLQLPRHLADFASIALSDEESIGVPSESKVPLACLRPNSDPSLRGPYLALGYHEPNQEMDRANKKFTIKQTSVLLREGKAAFYVSLRRDPAKQLLLGGKPSLIVAPRGRGGVPNFHGMSGSPIWRFDPTVPLTQATHPPLVAMLVSQPNNSRKIIQCDRIEVLTRHLAIAHPDLH